MECSGGNNRSFWSQAYCNWKEAGRKVSKRFNVDRKPHKYQVGDTVLYRMKLVRSKASNFSAKFLLRWSKPVVMAKLVRPNVVLLANPETGVTRRAQISQLKAFVE